MYSDFKQFIYKLIFVPILRILNYYKWKKYLNNSKKINLIIGAGTTDYKGWFATDIWTLDVTNENNYKKYFSNKQINKILAEHVLEHLTNQDLDKMLNNFYKYSANNINIRIAVPDGFHSNKNYIDRVKPGGTGEGASDHKNLFTYKSLSNLFEQKGFKTKLIEYWDENGKFHSIYSNDENGYISRCLINDDRNKNGVHIYTSLIIDFYK